MNCQKLIGLPVLAAMPIATTLALAATAVPLPPKSAPSANDHHSACAVSGSGAPAAIPSTIGAIVAA